MKPRQSNFWKVFSVPLAIGLVSATGLFAALLGGHLLGEGDRAARLAGALLIACGVVALALG